MYKQDDRIILVPFYFLFCGSYDIHFCCALDNSFVFEMIFGLTSTNLYIYIFNKNSNQTKYKPRKVRDDNDGLMIVS